MGQKAGGRFFSSREIYYWPLRPVCSVFGGVVFIYRCIVCMLPTYVLRSCVFLSFSRLSLSVSPSYYVICSHSLLIEPAEGTSLLQLVGPVCACVCVLTTVFSFAVGVVEGYHMRLM